MKNSTESCCSKFVYLDGKHFNNDVGAMNVRSLLYRNANKIWREIKVDVDDDDG